MHVPVTSYVRTSPGTKSGAGEGIPDDVVRGAGCARKWLRCGGHENGIGDPVQDKGCGNCGGRAERAHFSRSGAIELDIKVGVLVLDLKVRHVGGSAQSHNLCHHFLILGRRRGMDPACTQYVPTIQVRKVQRVGITDTQRGAHAGCFPCPQLGQRTPRTCRLYPQTGSWCWYRLHRSKKQRQSMPPPVDHCSLASSRSLVMVVRDIRRLSTIRPRPKPTLSNGAQQLGTG